MNFQELEKHLKFDLILRAIIYILIGLCFIVSLIAILTSPVKASELRTNDITATIKNPTECGTSSYSYYCNNDGADSHKESTNALQTGYLNSIKMDVSVNTWNTKSPSTIEIYNSMNTFRNVSYSCTLTAANSNNNISCSVVFVNSGKIIVNFNTGLYVPGVLFVRPSNSNSYYMNTGNYNINRVMQLQTIESQNTDVIDNATQNADNIMNNANQNTQTMVSKVEELFAQSVANSLQANNDERRTLANMCKNIYYTEVSVGKGLNSSGGLIDFPNSYYMTDYVAINTINDSSISSNANRLYIKEPASSQQGYYFVFYDTNKTFISLERTATRSVAIPNNAVWFRFSSPSANTVVSRYSNQCISADDLTLDYLKDDTNPNVDSNGINNVIGSVTYQDPLNYMLTLPLHLITKLNASLSASCSPVNLGTLFDTDLTLTCIKPQDYLGNSLYGTIDLLMGIGLLVIIIKNFYNTISNILTLGKEEEVKSKLSLPTPMEFLSMILGGGK